MSSNFVQSAALRAVAMGFYRAWARSQVWREGPRILINSIPKAGTHLLAAELGRCKGLQNSRLHLRTRDIVKDPLSNQIDPGIHVDRVVEAVATLCGGQYFSAHLPWSASLEQALRELEIATIFVLRDPRDILCSLYHYIVGLRRHPLHDFIADQGKTEFDRYRLLIEGHNDNPFIRPIALELGRFAPWLDSDTVLTVKFEELVGPGGGGCVTAKHDVLQRIATHAGFSSENLPRDIAQATGRTATLRKGKVGGWREELPADVQALVQSHCGVELNRLGYFD